MTTTVDCSARLDCAGCFDYNAPHSHEASVPVPVDPWSYAPLDVASELCDLLTGRAVVSFRTDDALGLVVDVDGLRNDNCKVRGTVLFDRWDKSMTFIGSTEDDRGQSGFGGRYYDGDGAIAAVVRDVSHHFGLHFVSAEGGGA